MSRTQLACTMQRICGNDKKLYASLQLIGIAESLHQQGKKLKPSSIDRFYVEPTKLYLMCHIRNTSHFLDFAKILQSPVPADSEMSISKVAFPSSPLALRQLMVHDPVSVVLTLRNVMQLFCTLNLLTMPPFSAVMLCVVFSVRGGSEVTLKWRVGDSPAWAST